MNSRLLAIALTITVGSFCLADDGRGGALRADAGPETDSDSDSDTGSAVDTDTGLGGEQQLTGWVVPASGVSTGGVLELKGGIAPSHAGQRSSAGVLSIVHLGLAGQHN